jgi:hypothetical protein
VISHVLMEEQEDFASPVWERLTEVGSSHVLFRGHDASILSSVRNSDGGADNSMGKMYRLSQVESQATCQAITIYLAWNSIRSFLGTNVLPAFLSWWFRCGAVCFRGDRNMSQSIKPIIPGKKEVQEWGCHLKPHASA